MTTTAVAAAWHGPDLGFRLTEVPLPSLAAGEVLVSTRTATLCGSDLHTIAGDRDVELPTVLGHEMVGDVVGTGGAVTAEGGERLEPGMRVTWTVGASCGSCPRCARGFPQKCASLRKYGHARMDPPWRLSGGLASHCHLLAGTGVVVVPDGLADEVAAPANCATATVVCAVRRLDVRAGETVVVTGCGMLGLTAVAYLRSLGVTDVVASDVDPARRALAARLGADAVTPDALSERVLDGTGGEGAAAAVDLSGHNSAIAAALELLAIGGRLGLVGSVFPTPALDLVPETVVRRLLTILGVHNYAATDLVEAVRFLDTSADQGMFREFVSGPFGLDRLDEAVRHATGHRPPRVSVTPNRAGEPDAIR
ncbi:zinc-binding dehydrogenase [Pseudonocardia acaciae]|uniref:zinc-binding dehydrogenase n=1 Tax=Pseudonocardia acaciae TaxID=551276 RepID=UPI0005609F58|nr:zinc-binding dehydrogenase [Pseudonocardia acaciae]